MDNRRVASELVRLAKQLVEARAKEYLHVVEDVDAGVIDVMFSTMTGPEGPLGGQVIEDGFSNIKQAIAFAKKHAGSDKEVIVWKSNGFGINRKFKRIK